MSMPAAHISETDLDFILNHTDGIWDDLRHGRIFITGGTGFFGCWLVESLLNANRKLGLDVRASLLTRDADAFLRKMPHLSGAPELEFIQGDVRSFQFPTGRFTHVIHAATEASVKLNDEQPLTMLDTITEGTRRTLEFARHAGVKKFLLASSGAVYGRQPPDLSHLPEDFTGAPDVTSHKAAYGEGKRYAEFLCNLYSRTYGMATTSARCFAFVGAHLPIDTHYAIGNFIRDGLSGGKIHVNGDGTPLRSYLYAADMAVWLWTILVKGKSGTPYNVGSDIAVSIADVANTVADCFPTPHPQVVIAKIPIDGAKPERYIPSIDRARRELSLNVWTNLEIAVNKALKSTNKQTNVFGIN